MATTTQWKDKNTGQKREETEWHRIAFFGRLAEIAGEYLKKGSQIYVEGRLRTRKWQDKDGQDRYTTEIVLTPYNAKLVLLDKRDTSNGEETAALSTDRGAPDVDDEIPV